MKSHGLGPGARWSFSMELGQQAAAAVVTGGWCKFRLAWPVGLPVELNISTSRQTVLAMVYQSK